MEGYVIRTFDNPKLYVAKDSILVENPGDALLFNSLDETRRYPVFSDRRLQYCRVDAEDDGSTKIFKSLEPPLQLKDLDPQQQALVKSNATGLYVEFLKAQIGEDEYELA